jgi:hypothetical protein
MGCGDVTVLEAGAVCVCDVSPLGHSFAPVFLQVRRPRCCGVGVKTGS